MYCEKRNGKWVELGRVADFMDLGVEVAGRYLGISEAEVESLIEKGELLTYTMDIPYYTSYGQVLVKRDSLERYAKTHKLKVNPEAYAAGSIGLRDRTPHYGPDGFMDSWV